MLLPLFTEVEMNWQAEYDKPVLILKNNMVTLREALQRPLDIQAEFSVRAGDTRESVGKSCMYALASLINSSESAPDQLRAVVVARLRSQPSRRFRFVDGKEFTAEQAASEVQAESAAGQYFTKLERRTLELIQHALQRGELH